MAHYTYGMFKVSEVSNTLTCPLPSLKVNFPAGKGEAHDELSQGYRWLEPDGIGTNFIISSYFYVCIPMLAEPGEWIDL